MSNSTFSGNRADNYGGGGIYNYTDSTLTVSNSTFSGNRATQYGGGIYNYLGTATVSNSTFSGNRAGKGGGGIYNSDNLGSNGVNQTKEHDRREQPERGNNCAGTITDGGGNLSYPDATCPGIYGDPLLGPLQDNGGPTQTMALLSGSAAIDAANDAICATPPVNNRDQRGVTRPQGPHCDIGAYEVMPPARFPADHHEIAAQPADRDREHRQPFRFHVLLDARSSMATSTSGLGWPLSP